MAPTPPTPGPRLRRQPPGLGGDGDDHAGAPRRGLQAARPVCLDDGGADGAGGVPSSPV